MNKVYFTFEDGSAKVRDVMSKAYGIKGADNSRPIAIDVYIDRDYEHFNEWLYNHIASKIHPRYSSDENVRVWRFK